MGISLFFLLFMRLLAEIGGSQDECKPSRCRDYGPVIRFPFRLKHQPDHCGYPGFELSCSEYDGPILELPSSVKLWVLKINYTSQEIMAEANLDYCHQRQIQNLTLSSSPFQFKHTYIEDFTFFNCSANKTDYFWSFPCNLPPSNPVVYAVPSNEYLTELNLYSCRKISEASLPLNIAYGESRFSMNWSLPVCGNCEAEGGKCSLKMSNGTEPEIECIKKPAKGASKTLMITGVTVGFFAFLLIVIILYNAYSSDKLKREHKIKIKRFLEDYRTLNPSRYSYADIKKITNQFKDKLGQGGYGTVYKGKFSNEVLVAVKILDDSKGNREEFINEVGIMGRIHHVNVVRLVGFCADGCKRALIYEFLPNGSLENFLSSEVKKHSLGWQKLQDIAGSIAKGVEYLHQGCDQRILHFDIKPHNILLDHNFNPKISDFGLAKLCSWEQSAISMTTVRGTIGYIAPEVLSRNFGNVSYKSDVYSFGMLLLEIVGGRKNVIDITMENTSQAYFPEWVYNHLGKGEEVHIRIEEKGDPKIVKKLSIVGLWCIQWHPIDRPSMKVVVKMLEEGEDNLIMPPNPFTTIGPTRTNVGNSKTSP